MDNNVDINEELRIKNQELFLNKKKIDLETSMDTVIVFFSNYTNGLATEVNNKVCEMKNIDPNSEQSKIMGYTITKFFANLADELKKKVLAGVDSIKEKIASLTDEEYINELKKMSENVISQLLQYCDENVGMLVQELAGDDANG